MAKTKLAMVLDSTGIDLQHDPGNRPLVLAVDDDEDNLLLMSQSLELFGCSSMSAEDAKSAFALAQKYQPDIILLDMRLPDIDGIEFVRQLKQNIQTMNIPIIAVTALAQEADRKRFLAAGCTDYISKPFMLEDLEATLLRHLNLTPVLY